MKKFLLLAVAAMTVTLLSAPVAYAAPSPTEPDRLTELDDSNVPLAEELLGIDDSNIPLAEELLGIDDSNVPLADELLGIDDSNVPLAEGLEELEDEDVPLAYVPAPQTGVTGLSGMEVLTLVAMAFAVSGAVILAEARKRTDFVR